MTVRCAKCGEELMGAVNRCWRCGQTVPSHAGDVSQPPVRHVPAAVPAESDVMDGVVVEGAGPEDPIVAEVATGPTDPPSRETRRVGSPFTGGEVTERVIVPETPPTAPPVTRPRYPKNAGAAGSAIAAVFLGIVSLAICYLPTAALLTALAGLSMGLWGMYSPKRGVAILGVVLCCVAIALAGFNGAVWWYEYQYGMKPWENPVPYDPATEGAY